MISSLTKKMLRDIWHMRAQVLAISLVILSGVAVYIMSLSTLQSLQRTRQVYYQDQNFADVFVNLKRAPLKLLDRIKDIDGVQAADPRITAGVHCEVAGFSDPIQGQLISLTDERAQMLNKPYLIKGRWVSQQREAEVIVSSAFAKAHNLQLQDKIQLIINGKKREFSIVGVALSPEYIYQIAPGAIFPDYKRYAIIWMGQKAFEQAYDMEGAFNSLSIRVLFGTPKAKIKQEVDLLLEPYGGLGAIAREQQISHRFLQEEFKQLKTMAILFPIIFFSVAGFLLNIVMMRLIQTEREQIALLKAFGYSHTQILTYYLKMVVLIVLIGVALGVGMGTWMGQGLSEIYTDFYKFPYLFYYLDIKVLLSATLISVGIAVIGAMFAIQKAFKLMPAEGMRPEPPGHFKRSIIERANLFGKISYLTRMIFRNIERKYIKSLMTVLGIACACGILMVGNFQKAAIDYMVDVHFHLNQQEDVYVAFHEPVSAKSINALKSQEGVQYAEGVRSVPVRLRYLHSDYLTSLNGMSNKHRLRQVLTQELIPLQIPESGVVLSEYFREILGVDLGDQIQVEVLEGKKTKQFVTVVGFVKEFMGLGAYIAYDNLYFLLQEGPNFNGALLRIDNKYTQSILHYLKEMPVSSGITLREHAISNFYDSLAETILVFTFFVSLFGGSLAFGLVFSNAIISLAEHNRALATLRVLGLTQIEVTFILLGELLVLTLAAIPLGFLIGASLCQILAWNLQSELYRVPLVLTKFNFSYSALVVCIASVLSCMFIYYKIKGLDMIATLKAQE